MSRHALLLEDHAAVRCMLSIALSDEGFEVTEAETGLGSLAVLHSDAFLDLLVADFGLPGPLNGWQIASAARLIRPNLKVLMVTGYAIGDLTDGALMPDGILLLGKPMATGVFTDAVHALMMQGNSKPKRGSLRPAPYPQRVRRYINKAICGT